MFCTECGTSNPDNAKFCNVCGKAFLASPSFSEQTEPEVVVRQFPIAARGGPRGATGSATIRGKLEPTQTSTALLPTERIHPQSLPTQIGRSLNEFQLRGLAFGKTDYKVSSSHIQTFQLSAETSGIVVAGGLARAMGWQSGAFVGLGTINQQTLNHFRTDIQIKLEDIQSSEKVFLARSVPLAITVSVDSGEQISVFFARGGLANPTQGDFRFNGWEPFAAYSKETEQIIPLAPLPTLVPPKTSGAMGCSVLLLIFGALFLVAIFLPDNTDSPLLNIGLGMAMLGAGAVWLLRTRRLREEWREELDSQA